MYWLTAFFILISLNTQAAGNSTSTILCTDTINEATTSEQAPASTVINSAVNRPIDGKLTNPHLQKILNEAKEQVSTRAHIFQDLLYDTKKYKTQLYWLRRLGFTIKANEFIEPPLDELIQTYKKLMDEVVTNWNTSNPHNSIGDKDIILPRLALRNAEEWIISELKAESNYEELEYMIKNTVTGTTLYKSLSQGFFPMYLGYDGRSTLYHDIIGHLTGYLEHPDYMKEYRTLAREIHQNIGFTELFYNQETAYARVFYFNEGLVLGSKQKLEKYKNLFPYRNLEFSQPQKFEDSYRSMASELLELEISVLEKLAEQFTEEYDNLYLHMGGGSRDSINNQRGPGNLEIPYKLKEDLEKAYELSLEEDDSSGHKPLLANILAKNHWLYIHLSKITVKEWRQAILKKEPSEFFTQLFSFSSSNTYQVFLNHQIGKNTSGIHSTEW